MIKKIVIVAVFIAIVATVAYEMGWLSYRGEKVYDKTKDTVLEKGKQLVDQGKEAVQ